MSDFKPTPEEAKAIRSLQRLARKWPPSLWLFSASGSLCVMKCGPDGEHLKTHLGGVDPDASLATIDISNDGGDW